MKAKRGRRAARVDQELDGAEAAVARRLAHASRRRPARPARTPVVDADRRRDLDRASGAGAAGCIRGPRGGRPRRCRRRGSAPRRAARAGRTARRRARRRRTPPCASDAQRSIGLGQVLGAGDRPHAAPAAAGQRLQHHRAALAERGQERLRLLERWSRRACRAGSGRRRSAASSSAAVLSPNSSSVSGRRPDEGEPGLGAARREGGVLAEEAVAGMDGVAAARLGRRDDLPDVEIGRRAQRPSAPRPRRRAATCSEAASSSAKTATVAMPISAAVRAMRMAISPRLAISSFFKCAFLPGGRSFQTSA